MLRHSRSGVLMDDMPRGSRIMSGGRISTSSSVPEYKLLINAEDTDGSGSDSEAELLRQLANLDDEYAAQAPSELVMLDAEQAELENRLRELNDIWETKKSVIEEQIQEVQQARLRLMDVEEETKRRSTIVPPGPGALAWVDSVCFQVFCNAVVLVNLVAICMGTKILAVYFDATTLDLLFLMFYFIELSLRILLHQDTLFIGAFCNVWWNWLDVIIVTSGFIDQLLIYLANDADNRILHSSAFRSIRLLRLCRVMRCMRLVRLLFQADLSFADHAYFESFMMCIIALNGFVLGMELDYEWDGFRYVDGVFLSVYLFELIVKFRRWGCAFFVEKDSWAWNNLDFIIVTTGLIDQWMSPTAQMVLDQLSDKPVKVSSSNLGGTLAMFRIMRLLRVLRLVKLFRSIKPLYRLLVGVMEALQAMYWVLILTMIVLYGGAIVFTCLVGHGYLYGGADKAPSEAIELFGTVPQSLFSLFKLMNGQITVVHPITNTVVGRLLFAMFMILANWAILAILTSVVSDHMITTSQKHMEEDAQKAFEENELRSRKELMAIFRQIDEDGSGDITEAEWDGLLNNKHLLRRVCTATELSEVDLRDLFQCLRRAAENDFLGSESCRKGRLSCFQGSVMDYQAFIANVKSSSKIADKRSQLHVLSKLRAIEARMESGFRDITRRLEAVEER
eukprot:TRINITY_DN14912_c0_g1_i3.p1 TRINITY_DN14912_c0_g1~~TRINITY_DN14912_c0_g1_i3.p1  ORF type:complete len:677 (+),score=100.27 TRINITY_DN14912_c0_g1_i3:57-2087(+)